MNVKLGTDIVHIPRFKEKLEANRWKFERDVFFDEELSGSDSIEHLAGIFAAKEAAIKALDLTPGNWKAIKIQKESSGKPTIALQGDLADPARSCDVSISHAGEYAIAVVIYCDA